MSIFYLYWFWGGLGVIVGAALCARNMVKNGVSFPLAVIILTIGTYGGLIMARALYVALFVPQLFTENFFLAMAFWQQTGTWFGAPIGGAMGVILSLWIFKQPVWSNLGSCAPGIALTHVLARIGCIFEGCCYGTPTTVKWAIFSSELNQMVHPTQVYSIMGETFNLVLLQYLWRKPGNRIYLGPLYCMILASHRFIAEFFRGCDPGGITPIPGLRTFQSVCIFLFVAAALTMAALKWRKQAKLIIISGILVFSLSFTGIRYFASAPMNPVMVKQKRGLFLVLTRHLFDRPVRDLLEVKKGQGYQVLYKSWTNAPAAGEVQTWLANQHQKNQIQYVLIVGDTDPEKGRSRKWHFPARINWFKKGDKTVRYPTDALYGDLDGDGFPELPVGRLPVQTVRELNVQISKIKKYDAAVSSPEWYRSVIWVGAKGYTAQMRSITNEMVGKLPAWITPRIIGNKDPSTGTGPSAQPRAFISAMGRPAFLSIVASHGSYRSLTIKETGKEKIFLSVEDLAGLSSHTPNGALMFLACEAGQYNLPLSKGPSLSEAFMAKRGGPIALVAATAETSPLTNYFMITHLLQVFRKHPTTIGELLLSLQQNLYRIGNQSMRQLAARDPRAKELVRVTPEKEKFALDIPNLLRHELLMYQVLGDPSSELKIPGI